MKKIITLLTLTCAVCCSITAQKTTKKSVIYTSDIDNFWIAYDSILTTTDTIKQLAYINDLYINRGTEGLKAFMELSSFTASRWIKQIKQFPKFWNSERKNT